MKKVILLFLAFCLCLGGCSVRVEKSGSPTETASEAPAVPPTEPIIQAEDPVSDVVPLSEGREYTPGKPKVPDDDFYAALCDFSVELFKRELASKGENENVLLSPFSVLFAMGMSANGAENETLTEMLDVMVGGMSLAELNECINYYTRSFKKIDSPLRAANSVWIREAFAAGVKDGFITDNVNNYKAEIFKAPFNEDTKEAVNQWVSDKTDGKIDGILDSMDRDAVMYLINALLFEAEWNTPFSPSRDGIFTDALGNEQTVEMMSATVEYLDYIELDGVTGFYKPYDDTDYRFLALLPADGTSAAEYAGGLSGDDFRAFAQSAVRAETVVRMPAFKAQTETELAAYLSDMGIKRAFNCELAQFGGISDGKLYISSVAHKATIDVNRYGTSAAAVTSVGKMTGIPEDPKVIILDRPFVYAIVDGKGTPIFIGVQNSIE